MNRRARFAIAFYFAILLPFLGLAGQGTPATNAAASAAATPRREHTNGVTGLAFTPDGATLVSVGRDSTVKFTDVATIQDRRVLTGHESSIRGITISPDGKLLASAGEDTKALLWDVATGKLLRVLEGHKGFVNAAAFSPDGTTLATASDDARIFLWNVATGATRKVLRGHAGAVTDVAFSPDGATLASASADKTVKLWDVAAGVQRRTLAGHTAAVTSIRFGQRGAFITSASKDKTVKLWNVATGALVRTFSGHTKGVNAVAFSPDGQSVASGGDDNSIELWNANTGQSRRAFRLQTKSVTSVAFSPDGATLASGSADESIVLWDVATGQPRGSTGGPQATAVAPAGATPAARAAAPTAAPASLAAAPSAALAPEQGPGGPILVISSAANLFNTYYAEVLRNEGFNEFDVADIGAVSAATLAGYDVVILGQTTLTASQVAMFDSWVNAGGNLIAMRPDKQLAGLLGLADANATLSNGYLLVNTAQAPGNGIVGQTIQYHGAADRYTLSGATSVATLYSSATAATSNPAVSLRSVGTSGGQAAAFTFDLARSLVYMRQGNPAWAAQERDGETPIRPDDLFFGAAAADPQTDWVDLSKAAIPQADEQQRLLANLIIQMNLDKKPLPRFWYLPFGKPAALLMTGDDHANGGTAGRFDQFIAASAPGCSVANWECVRGTSYIYPNTPLTNVQAAAYEAQGFEVALHVNTDCADYTPASLESFYSQQLSAFAAKYTGVPAPTTQRHHCIAWSDWLTGARVQLNHGQRLDTSYYFWPPYWVLDRPGFFSSSAMPMRMVDTDGSMLDVYEAVTQMTDESGQSYPSTVNALLDKAVGPEGYYGVYTVNAHTDAAQSAVADAVLDSAQARGVPIVSARQMLTWLDARNASSFGALSWSGGTLSFTIAPGAGANGLRALLPTHTPSGALASLTRAGGAVSYTVQTIKGIEYAAFSASSGTYAATYALDTTPPAVSSTAPASGATSVPAGTTVTATFSEAVDPTTVNGTNVELRDSGGALVSASVTYNAVSRAAVLAPSTSLAFGASYTARVKGGASGVKDTSGNALAADVTWSFSTAAAPACPCSIWGGSDTPVTPATSDPNPVELGVRFRSDLAGQITGIRFYKGSGNTGTHTGSLWTTGGQLLATATFASETATGWQQVSFGTPVAIAANTTYIASYHTNAGNYAFDSGFFTSAGVDNAPLHALRDGQDGANGVYAYGAGGFPDQTFQAANYWVDVLFTASGVVDTTPPTVTATTPASGATGVAVGSSVTATFSEPLSAATVSGTTFQLTGPGGAAVAAAVSYNSATNTATLAPSAALATNTSYTARVVGGASGVKDLAGNALAADVTWTFTTATTASPCSAPANPIVAENCLTGNPASEWDISGAGDTSIQGFATDISVNRGSTVTFKVSTNASSYRLDIYRMGYYAGLGARKIATVTPSASLPQSQPNCLTVAATKLLDCGNWAVSASWAVPATATSGIYFAKLVRADTGGASHVFFIVRDDASHSDLLFQTSDTTWQAYNDYGGASLYGANGVEFDQPNRGVKVSYNRPFHTRVMEKGVSWVFNAEYPMVRWLESNGYDVSYFTGVDADRFGSLIRNHKVFMPVGHDEYWSGPQRANVEAARNAGVNLAFFTGNGVFWKTRWENSIDGSNTPYRTLVSYKETHDNSTSDPQDPPTWTGTWRDPRFSPPADGGKPENALMGTIFMVNGPRVPPDAIQVPAADGKMRFWRNTTIASLTAGQTVTLGAGTLGFEWDVDADNGARPAGLVRLSSTSVSMSGDYLLDFGSNFGSGTANHALTLYRHSSGALVFGAGTIQWSWGLDANHDTPNYSGPAADVRMRQATVNLFADMLVQPATLQAGLTPATASTDVTAPASAISSPANGANVAVGAALTISGTATDTGGGVVGGVEVSVDGGATWHPANGRGTWTYSWTPTASGTATIKSRAADDSGNLETPGPGATITVGTGDTTPPTVTATTPASGATGVATNATVSAVFSEALSAATVSGTTFQLTGPGGVAVAAVVSYNSANSTATLAPSAALAASTSYTARVVGGASGVKDLAGNALAADLTWTFTTAAAPDTIPPTVTATTPASGATGVAVGSSVTATFSEPLSAATVSGTTFQLTGPGGAVAAVVSYNSATNTATLAPSAALAANTSYTARVVGGASGVKDLAGNALAADFTWTFTTAVVTTPVTLVGDTTIRSSQDSNSAGQAEAFQYTALASGTASRIYIYIDSGNTATRVVVGLYSNTAGNAPGTLLAQATINSPTSAAWNSVALPAANITSGTSYWIAVLGPSGAGTVRFRDVSGGGGRAQTSSQTNLTSLAATWSAGASFSDSPMSAYVVQEGPPDTQAPTVALTAPAAGATVSGATVTVSASASDNVAVASVQFLLDGAALGAPDTSAPYSITWNSTTATNGAHTLSARAADAAGNSATAPNVAVTTSNVDTTPPAAPAGLTATASAGGIALAWASNAEADLAGYNVYRAASAGGPYTKLNTTLLPVAGYNDTAAPIGVTSFYRVTAVDTVGNESAPATTSAVRPDGAAPAEPTGLAATAAASGIGVAWAGSPEADLAGYNVYRAASAGGPYTKLNLALLTSPSFDDTLAPSGTSFYQVSAVDLSGNESAHPTSASATMAKANRAPNPGFETDANGDGRPDSWTSSARFTRSSVAVRGGTVSGRHNATNNASYTLTSTAMTGLAAGTTYNFAGWVNVPATTDAFTIQIQVRWRNASNGTISTATIATYNAATGGWVKATSNLVAPAGTTNALLVMAVTSLNATVYVDDFAFR